MRRVFGTSATDLGMTSSPVSPKLDRAAARSVTSVRPGSSPGRSKDLLDPQVASFARASASTSGVTSIRRTSEARPLDPSRLRFNSDLELEPLERAETCHGVMSPCQLRSA